MLTTTEGRNRFWAGSAEEQDGIIRFHFTNGQQLDGRIIERVPPFRFGISYFGGSIATFELEPDGSGGTDLTLTETGSAPHDLAQNQAGWVSVLLALKAAVDFGIDLRSHDPARTWEQGYVDV
jgi:hypothetical protein